ncbi:MAG: hypothetical protein V4560_18305 [Bacteroidota bacterium]|jgi:hypothetical protein
MFEIEAPNYLGEAKVICYAVVNLISLRNEEQKLACFVTICQYKPNDGYYLFYCDSNWNVFADTWHEIVEDAQDQAEYDYAGISNKWISR